LHRLHRLRRLVDDPQAQIVEVLEYVARSRLDAGNHAVRPELIVLGLECRILTRLHLPLASIRPQRECSRHDLFTVSHAKVYELVQHAAKGTWELVVTDLDAAGRL
jgi:hypothetical protein